MKKIMIVGAALAALIGTPALAADMALKAPPPAPVPTSNWTGFYLGAHAGVAWWSSNQGFTETPGIGGGDALDPINFGHQQTARAIGGLQGGYNWQVSPMWVLGVEGDFSWTSLRNNATAVPTFGGVLLPGNVVAMSESVNWLASARGKIGYVWGPTLLYATGGAAWENAHYTGNFTFLSGATENIVPFSTTNSGWVAGGGLEWMATSHLLARIEYLYYGFQSKAVSAPCVNCVVGGPPVANYSWNNNNVQVVRAALSYKF
jgi:outer membrane immunogenic protein